MGFFHNEAKASKPAAPKQHKQIRLASMPLDTMADLGCKVCPKRDVDDRDYQILPEGAVNPDVYFLIPSPTARDGIAKYADDWREPAMRGLFSKWPNTRLKTRVGGLIQCVTSNPVPDNKAVACCTNYVARDIEESKPLVVVGVGDAALEWAMQISRGAPTFRGRFLVTKIGTHVCYYYPLNYPNWAFSKHKNSDQERLLERDIEHIVSTLENGDLDPPERWYEKEDDYYKGIELITGNETGDLARLERTLADLQLNPRNALDLETNGLRPWRLDDPRIWMAAVGTYERTVAFALDHPEGWTSEVQRRKAWQMFGEWILYSGPKIAHNVAMEMEWLAYFYGNAVLRTTEWDDTMSQTYALDQRDGTKGLGMVTRVQLGFDVKALSNLDAARIVEYPIKKSLMYNALDTKYTHRVDEKMMRELRQDPALVYANDRRVRLASTLVMTEQLGMPTDMDFARELSARLESEVRTVEKKLLATDDVRRFESRFGKFEPTNDDHHLKLLRDICERSEVRIEDPRTKEVKYSTGKEILSTIPARKCPPAPLILDLREVHKIWSTYARPAASGAMSGPDGRIHGKYSSMRAETHRLASEDPNLQNWPKRKHKEIRGVIAAAVRKILLACDYGQIEFRVFGMASEDDNLVKYCWTGYDVHKYWAERMVDLHPSIKDWIVKEFKVDWDEKGLKTLRQEAKNKWVFPSLFGAAVFSRAANLHLPTDVADKLDKEFWDEFPGVKRWQKRTVKFYEKNLYVETLGGLRRYGPLSENQIINMPIQGTAAEIVTEAMMALSERAYLEDRYDIHPILNVHDDLTFEVDDDNIPNCASIIATEMCRHRFDYINVPLVVEISKGKRWSDLEEIAVYRSNELFSLVNPYA